MKTDIIIMAVVQLVVASFTAPKSKGRVRNPIVPEKLIIDIENAVFSGLSYLLGEDITIGGIMDAKTPKRTAETYQS